MARPSCGAMSRLRVPMLISRFLPFSVLLGTLIAFVGLNQHSEVVAMKAAGLSAHQILAPMIVASLGVAGARLRLQRDGRRQRRRARSTAWSDADYQPIPPDSGILSNVWMRDGDDLVHARLVGGRGAAVRLRRRDHLRARGRNASRSVIDAERRAASCPAAGGCDNVRIYDAAMNIVLQAARRSTALDGVEPTRFTLAKVDPDAARISSR